MTISSFAILGSAGNTVAQTVWEGAFQGPWDANATAVVAIVTENIATTTGPTNTHTSLIGASLEFAKIDERTISNGVAADGVTISLWSARTISLVGTLNFTAEFSASVANKCAVARQVASDLDLQVDFNDGRTNAASSAFGSLGASGLPSKERAWFRASGMAYAASTNATPTSTWTIGTKAESGSGAAGIMGRSEYKIATSTGETSTMTQNVADDSASIIVAFSEDTGGAGITLSPDPVSVKVGTTSPVTISRDEDAPAGAGVTYNLTSDTPAVATVPATVNMPEGQTTATFDVTGVGLGSATITATNSADSGETDSITVNVVALRKLKVLAHVDALSATAVSGRVFKTTGGTRTYVGRFTGAAFGSTAESGKAPLKVDVEDFGGEALTTSDTVEVTWSGTSAAGSALGNAAPIGSVGEAVTASIIEE